MDKNFPEYNEFMGDAYEEIYRAFGGEYEIDLELDCPVCGTYGYCDCQTTDLDKF
jgi:hypothetical protein